MYIEVPQVLFSSELSDIWEPLVYSDMFIFLYLYNINIYLLIFSYHSIFFIVPLVNTCLEASAATRLGMMVIVVVVTTEAVMEVGEETPLAWQQQLGAGGDGGGGGERRRRRWRGGERFRPKLSAGWKWRDLSP